MGADAAAAAAPHGRGPDGGRQDHHSGYRGWLSPRAATRGLGRRAFMNTNLPQLIDAFAGLDVLVLGEAMLDSYLEGAVGRFCQEAPVPIVALAGRRDMPGGAANSAVNVRSLGGRVSFLSVTGEDAEGEHLRQALRTRGVSTEHVLTRPGRRTLTQQRVM